MPPQPDSSSAAPQGGSTAQHMQGAAVEMAQQGEEGQGVQGQGVGIQGDQSQEGVGQRGEGAQEGGEGWEGQTGEGAEGGEGGDWDGELPSLALQEILDKVAIQE